MRCALPALPLLAALLAVPAFAKLPPPSDEAKAKAAEAAAKTAWSDKVGAYKLCRAMNQTVEAYHRHMKAEGKDVPAPTETPACVDPGPYAAAPPIEAAGAHSPATTAVAPPSSKATAAELQGKPHK